MSPPVATVKIDNVLDHAMIDAFVVTAGDDEM
jgi:hypothetical protein